MATLISNQNYIPMPFMEGSNTHINVALRFSEALGSYILCFNPAKKNDNNWEDDMSGYHVICVQKQDAPDDKTSKRIAAWTDAHSTALAYVYAGGGDNKVSFYINKFSGIDKAPYNIVNLYSRLISELDPDGNIIATPEPTPTPEESKEPEPIPEEPKEMPEDDEEEPKEEPKKKKFGGRFRRYAKDGEEEGKLSGKIKIVDYSEKAILVTGWDLSSDKGKAYRYLLHNWLPRFENVVKFAKVNVDLKEGLKGIICSRKERDKVKKIVDAINR